MSEPSLFGIIIFIISQIILEVVMIRKYYSKNATIKNPTALICTTIACGLFFGFLLSMFRW